MKNFDLLSQEFEDLTGDSLNIAQLASAHRYADLLAEWNQKINLTSINDPDEVRIKHFLDSLSCHLVLSNRPKTRVIDIGTGGGFPGLPLKLLYPEMNLILADSVAKKTAFLSLVVQELDLDQVAVLTERAETLGQMPEHREQYDLALARAVANLPVLVEYLLPLVKVGGIMLAQKGETAIQELAQAKEAIALLGGKSLPPVEVQLPKARDKRYLLVIEKSALTPSTYPRRVGIPAKRPLKNG
ncbi:MAG: 16S rRNA (guanine(527)-N(7))-methyltransferase RsmG [Anaerolineales bacterium]|nr:16S rRNA (guanine(527)-N(7))-methyltransferase RsmG [Anaerolineales bacterium]